MVAIVTIAVACVRVCVYVYHLFNCLIDLIDQTKTKVVVYTSILSKEDRLFLLFCLIILH